MPTVLHIAERFSVRTSNGQLIVDLTDRGRISIDTIFKRATITISDDNRCIVVQGEQMELAMSSDAFGCSRSLSPKEVDEDYIHTRTRFKHWYWPFGEKVTEEYVKEGWVALAKTKWKTITSTNFSLIQ